jgi:hypothetical protein
MLRRRTSGWHRVRLPRIGNSVLDGVAWGSTHAYAVGEARGGPIVLERTGQSWVQRTVATPGGPILEGIGASVDGAVWAVGLRFNANGDARSVAETPCT